MVSVRSLGGSARLHRCVNCLKIFLCRDCHHSQSLTEATTFRAWEQDVSVNGNVLKFCRTNCRYGYFRAQSKRFKKSVIGYTSPDIAEDEEERQNLPNDEVYYNIQPIAIEEYYA